jgi:hypothetical protein
MPRKKIVVSPSRQRKRLSSNKVNCSFKVQFKQCHNSEQVMITNICAMHVPECNPGDSLWLSVVHQKNCSYSNIRKENMIEIIKLLRTGIAVPPKMLRALLKPCFPAVTEINASDLCNIRSRCKQLEKKLIASGDIDLYENKVDFRWEGMEATDTLCDAAIQMSSQLLHETMASSNIFVAAEGFVVCGELHDAYLFLLESLFDMAPGRNREDVYIVFSDMFLSQNVIDQAGMTALHLWDHYHLKNEDWPIAFGQYIYSNIKGKLENMCNATSEEKFFKYYAEAHEKLASQPKHCDYLDKFGKRPEKFASYKIKRFRGNLGHLGSSHSERSHASIVSKVGKCLLVEPHEAVMWFLERQKI